MFNLLIILNIAATSGPAFAVRDDAELVGCVGQLSTVTLLHKGGLTDVTGIVSKVTKQHVDFGGVLVPRKRFFIDDFMIADVGDLIAVHHADARGGRHFVKTVVGVLESVGGGTVHLQTRTLRAAELVG